MYQNEKKPSRCDRNEGYTLIEVLIAVMVFAIMGTAIIQMQIKSMQGTSTALGVTEASLALTSEIERLLALDYDDPLLLDNTTENTVVAGATLSFDNQYNVNEQLLPGSTTEMYKVISVRTSWTKAKKRNVLQGQTIKLK